MKLGIFGGTFDPIHLGHLRTAVEIGQELVLEKVFLIPSASPPHKTEDPVSPFQLRLTMAKLAIGDSQLLEVLDLEGKRPGLSYSIETLREFHSTFGPEQDFYFLLGVDAFLEIKTWKEYVKLFDYAHFVIIPRPGYQDGTLKPFLMNLGLNFEETKDPDQFMFPSGKRIVFKATTFIDISSTRIRQMVAAGKSIRYLVPEAVRDFIIKKRLYSHNGNN